MDLGNTSSDESTNRAQMMQLQQQNGGGAWTPRERFAVQRNRSFMPPRTAVPGAGRGAPFAREEEEAASLYRRQILAFKCHGGIAIYFSVFEGERFKLRLHTNVVFPKK